MTRIAVVKYLNTLPMLAGLERSPVSEEVDVQLVDPASCAKLLLNGDVDVALCPIGALVGIDEYYIASAYGIGCDGPVRTVAVYSDQPLSELRTIELFSESRSSNLLVQVLEKRFWKYGLDFVAPGTQTEVPTGHLAIGDQCFRNEAKYEYITDLGDMWKRYTGLPFLFAAWVSLKPVDKELWRRLDMAFAEGIAHVDQIELPPGNAHVDLRHYLQKNIKYRITDEMLQGARLYLEEARELSKNVLNADSTPSGKSLRTNH